MHVRGTEARLPLLKSSILVACPLRMVNEQATSKAPTLDELRLMMAGEASEPQSGESSAGPKQKNSPRLPALAPRQETIEPCCEYN